MAHLMPALHIHAADAVLVVLAVVGVACGLYLLFSE